MRSILFALQHASPFDKLRAGSELDEGLTTNGLEYLSLSMNSGRANFYTSIRALPFHVHRACRIQDVGYLVVLGFLGVNQHPNVAFGDSGII